MAQSSLQLNLENALKAYIQAQNTANNYFESGRTVNAGHAIDNLPDAGNYVAILADPPDWSEMIYACELTVTLRVATQVRDPGTRTTKSADHSRAVGAVIQIFCDQNFEEARDALNAAQTGAFRIGFIGWDALKPEPDSYADAQIVTILPYTFEIFISQDA